MNNFEKIRTVIIDDSEKSIDSLKENLSVFPEIDICGFAAKHKQASELLVKEKPDLIFLDIEMPGKNGFELLNEVRKKGCGSNVIFCTAYDKYMIRALRESAFDYIIKPIDPKELKNAIDRYKIQRGQKNTNTFSPCNNSPDGTVGIVALPTHLGLRFMDKDCILLFRCIHENRNTKPCWEALLTDLTSIKLGTNTSAGRIIQLLSEDHFVQINQSCIVNLHYINMVEFKTRNCLLVPPFDNMKLTVSRIWLLRLREMYEKF